MAAKLRQMGSSRSCPPLSLRSFPSSTARSIHLNLPGFRLRSSYLLGRQLPPPAWVPVEVVVPAFAVELPVLAWLPVEVFVVA